MQQATCSLSFDRTLPADAYVVALQVEDYDVDDVTFSTPLSSVPFQWALHVLPVTGAPCGLAPWFIEPTPVQGAVLYVDARLNQSLAVVAASKDAVTGLVVTMTTL